MNDAAASPQTVPTPRGGGRLLALLLTLFALPFVVVAGLFAIDWRPQSAGNYGEIVAGMPALPWAELVGSDGRALPADALAGRWTLLVATAHDCAEPCRERLDLTRRLHVALNKNMPRVRRLLLAPSPAADAGVPALRAAWPDLLIASPGDAAWRAQLAALPAQTTVIYVLDPQGRPVLRYSGAAFDARRALRDVERLLKVSWIG